MELYTCYVVITIKQKNGDGFEDDNDAIVPSFDYVDDNDDNLDDDNDVIVPSLAVVFPRVHFVGQRWRGGDGKSTDCPNSPSS